MSDLQLAPVLPHIVEPDDIRMLDQLHDHAFPFNAEWDHLPARLLADMRHDVHAG